MSDRKASPQKKVSLPGWMGRLPFPPDQKRGVVITKNMEVKTLYTYGFPPHQIKVQKYISTDKITIGDFPLQSGEYFEPPSCHPSPEFYYMLSGTATVFDPQNGETYQIAKGDSFWISSNAWHQAFNFGKEESKILSISPVLYSSSGDTVENNSLEISKFYPAHLQLPDRIPGDLKRKARAAIFPIREEEYFNVVTGQKYHLLLSLIARDESMSVGILHLPAKLFSEPETHLGDEVIYVLEGQVVVSMRVIDGSSGSESYEYFEASQTEKILIPENTEHQYFNFSKNYTKILLAVAPSM